MSQSLTILLGNTHEPHEVSFPTGRTTFQDQTVRQIVQRDDFDFACNSYELPNGSQYRGPFSFLWYDIEGHMHAIRIGQRRALRDLKI